MFYADRSSKDKTIFVKNQKYERGGQLKYEFVFGFIEITLEPLHLDN
jgi:hypothetical protein